MSRSAICAVLALCCVHTAGVAQEQTAPLRALLISGGCCHDYGYQATKLIEGVTARANVAWRVEIDPRKGTRGQIDFYNDPDWANGYDVVVHNECFAGTTDPEYIRRITEAHKAGVSAVVIHCAMHTYRAAEIDDWREFLGVSSFRHEHQATYPVTVVARDHPVMAGFPKNWRSPRDELYVIRKMWPNTKALATAKSERTDEPHAVFWVSRYGKARVFGTTFGHGNATFDDDVFIDTVTKGLLWAAGKLGPDGKPTVGFTPSRKTAVGETADPGAGDSFAVSMEVDASGDRGAWRPIWRFFGADEPNYAYMKNGKKLLAGLGEMSPKNVYFRAHNLLTSGDGTPALKWGSTGAYREDEQGRSVYDWTILDRIFDAYLSRGVRPYAQIGFMPKDLSVRPEPYRHQWRPGIRYNEIYTGWAHPPKDYARWAELVYQWTKHCVERYGREEVETWYWEVWNEPNIGYWQGTREEFLKLHDYAIDAVRRALPTARVGGADTAGSGGSYTRAFLEHCLRGKNYATGQTGTPLDFVSFHAKGAPRHLDGHVRMGISNQLRTIDAGFRIVASYPELKETPVIIGESDPEGCAACQGPQLAYRNGTMYSSYTAASFARKLDLAERHRVNFEGALTWAFEFEDQPYFAGFRSLATNGLDKPVLNVFRMFSRMSGRRVPVGSDHEVPLDSVLRDGVRVGPDVAALASRDGNRLSVLAWHYLDDDLPGPAADVEMVLSGLPAGATEAGLEHFRIDEEHSNAFSAWKRMGSPQEPSAEQYAKLEGAGRLAKLDSPDALDVADGKVQLRFQLPRQAVSLLIVEWKKTETARNEKVEVTPPEGDYQLVWSDEFEKDGPPEPRNWDYERGFVRNRELQWYRPENARCENGLLVIEARRERVKNPRYEANSRHRKRSREYADYTSASLRTKGLHEWQYGRFEMRGRIDVRQGLWPAFWTLGSAREWPGCGEIDIMEFYRGTLLANAAWASGRRWRAAWDDSKRPIGEFGDPDWAKKFHVWRMDWDESEIRLYVDDLLLNTIDLETTVNRDREQANPLREPHYLILNLAIGGTQGGDPSATEFPARFEIDYVRVLERERR